MTARPEVAVLDRHGVITAVNEAWVEFARSNGVENPVHHGVGTSYLAVCDAARDTASALVASAIRRAVAGDLPEPERVTLACDSPAEDRVFTVTVSSRFADDGSCVGATVVLVQVPTAPVPRRDDPPETTPAHDTAVTLSEQVLASLAEAAPDGLLVTDEHGVVVHANARLEALTGYLAADLVGRPVEQLVPDELRATHRLLHARFRASPRTRLLATGGALALRRRDGSSLPVEIALRPGRLEGRPVVLAAVRDVSARQAAEERGELVAQALDAISDGVAVLDARSGRRLYVNRAVLELSGHTSLDDLADVPIGSPSTDAEETAIRGAINAVVTGEVEEVALDTRVEHRHGSTVPVELRIAHVPPPAGQPGLGRVLLISRDITDRLTTQRRLEAGEESFRTVFEQSPIGVLVARIDVDGRRRIVRLNPAAAELFGEPAEELIGADPEEFTLPEDRERDADLTGRLAREEVTEFSRLKCYRRRDGSRFWAEVRAVPIELPDLAGPLAVLHMVDVTDRHRAVERLQVTEASFRTVFEQSPIAAAVIHLTDQGQRRQILMANPALGHLLGQGVGAVLGTEFTDYTLPEHRAALAAVAGQFVRGERDHLTRTTPLRHRDGRTVWVDVRATTITLPSAAGLTLLAFLTDVTARHELDHERQLRARSTRLVAEVTTAILAGNPPEHVYQQIAAGAALLMDADDATLGIIEPGGDARPIAAVGPIGTALLTGVLPVRQDLIRRLAAEPRCLFSATLPDLPDAPAPAGATAQGAAVRFLAGRDQSCLLTVARAGTTPFTDADLSLLADFVHQLTLAIQLGEARLDQEWLALLEERQRIARDLHDTVTQDIISVGMQLDLGLGGELDPDRHVHRDAVITQLEQAVQRLRGTLVDLQPTVAQPGLSGRVRAIAADASRALGLPVALSEAGPLDRLPGGIAHHATAVIQEALANVRHARAGRSTVSITATEHDVTVIVEDDGSGIPAAPAPGRGLVNLTERARSLGGTFSHEQGDPTGTRLIWTVPLQPSPAPGT